MRLVLRSAACGVVALGAFASAARAENKICANVSYRSPYTDRQVQARVGVRAGSLSCAKARGVAKRALVTEKTATTIGVTRYWSVGRWNCSSGGDGSVSFCWRPGRRIESTTATPGGYWAEP